MKYTISFTWMMLWLAAVLAPDLADAAERRVALVIGNGAYGQRPLKNPPNDAADLAQTLRALGFEVLERRDRGGEDMRRDLADFQDRLSKGAIGLFYFAGHGVQAGRGLNYLLPVGVDYRRERDAEIYGLEAGSVLRRMEESGAALSLVILDACRDSPLPAEGRSSASRGLGRMEAPSGSLIAFATAPGSTADENTAGRNGLYTKHLLAAIQTPGLPLEAVFKRVRRGVESETNRRQSPEEIMKLTSEEPFYFKPVAVAVAPPAPAPVRPVAPPEPATGRPSGRWISSDEALLMKSVVVSSRQQGDDYEWSLEGRYPEKNGQGEPNRPATYVNFWGAQWVKSEWLSLKSLDQTIKGNWDPGTSFLVRVRVPRDIVESDDSFNLRLCMGDSSGCYPSPNLHVRKSSRAAARP